MERSNAPEQAQGRPLSLREDRANILTTVSPTTSYTSSGNVFRRSLCEQVGGDLRCYAFLLLPDGEINAWAIV